VGASIQQYELVDSALKAASAKGSSTIVASYCTRYFLLWLGWLVEGASLALFSREVASDFVLVLESTMMSALSSDVACASIQQI
jgi:hypothetical protein